MTAIVQQKAAAIQRSVARAREEFAAAGDAFRTDFTRQDAAILNVLRACETAIDAANVVIRTRKLGLPQSARDSFTVLATAGLIPALLSQRLQRMIGFRNIAVHQYQQIDLAIVESILTRDLDDLLDYSRRIATLD